MLDLATVNIIDPSDFIDLEEAVRETNLPGISIVHFSPELVLDCRPKADYVWFGRGIVDQKLHQMPDLGRLTKESRRVFSSRLQNYNYRGYGFRSVQNLQVHTGEKILALARPSCGLRENIPVPHILVAANPNLYRQKMSEWLGRHHSQTKVEEGIPCLGWDHGVDELEMLSQLLELHGYIESAEVWRLHFRTPTESPFKITNAPSIRWLKNKKLMHIVFSKKGVKLKKDEWQLHFGIPKPGGVDQVLQNDNKLLEIIKSSARPIPRS
jgi:hypothetical protein